MRCKSRAKKVNIISLIECLGIAIFIGKTLQQFCSYKILNVFDVVIVKVLNGGNAIKTAYAANENGNNICNACMPPLKLKDKSTHLLQSIFDKTRYLDKEIPFSYLPEMFYVYIYAHIFVKCNFQVIRIKSIFYCLISRANVLRRQAFLL